MFYDVKTSYDKGLVVKNNSSLINKLFVVCISERLEDLYAFNYKPHAQDTLTRQAGWALFDISSEYSRMNIPNNEWVHTTINVDYKVSAVKMIFICCRCLDQPSIWECCTPTSPPSPQFNHQCWMFLLRSVRRIRSISLCQEVQATQSWWAALNSGVGDDFQLSPISTRKPRWTVIPRIISQFGMGMEIL